MDFEKILCLGRLNFSSRLQRGHGKRFIPGRGSGHWFQIFAMDWTRSSRRLMRVLCGSKWLALSIRTWGLQTAFTPLPWSFCLATPLPSPIRNFHHWPLLQTGTAALVTLKMVLWESMDRPCWFPALVPHNKKQFSRLSSLYFTALCYGVRARSDSWCAAEGTKFTHSEKWRKSIYLTWKLLVPPDFLRADMMVYYGTSIFCLLFGAFWTKPLLLFSFYHLTRFKFYLQFTLTSYLISASDMTILCSAKEVPGEINRNVYLQFQFQRNWCFSQVKTIATVFTQFFNYNSDLQGRILNCVAGKAVQRHFSSFMSMLYYFNIITL